MNISENELQALIDYQDETHSTAIYPSEHAVSYLLLGLLNEVWEAVNAETLEIAIEELGDIMWFLSELANLIDADLSALLEKEDEDDWTTPVGDFSAILAPVFVGEIADVSGYVAKYLRDGTVYSDRMEIVLSRCVKTFYSIIDVMSGLINSEQPDTVFLQLLVDNRQKLLDRQKRGVLGGSGNKR